MYTLSMGNIFITLLKIHTIHPLFSCYPGWYTRPLIYVIFVSITGTSLDPQSGRDSHSNFRLTTSCLLCHAVSTSAYSCDLFIFILRSYSIHRNCCLPRLIFSVSREGINLFFIISIFFPFFSFWRVPFFSANCCHSHGVIQSSFCPVSILYPQN